MKFLPNYSLIKNFNADFGSKVVFNFTAGAPLSIEETSPMDFDLYPNPTTHTLHIDMLADKGLMNEVSIFNIQGKLLHSFNSSAASFDADLANFDSGIYIITIKNEDGQLSRKFLKQ